MNLKTLQKFRYTLPIIGVLILVALGVGFISLTNNLAKPKETPLVPKYDSGESRSKHTLKPDWTKINLGITIDEIEKQIGKPNSVNQANGKTTYVYIPSTLTPLATHEITFLDNKVIRIKRNIDSFYDQVSNIQFIQKYGKPAIIREQKGIDTYSLQAFKMNTKNDFVITEVDRQNNAVYNIYIMTESSYKDFIEEIKQATLNESEDSHEGFEVEAL
jgi:hypothetical protein